MMYCLILTYELSNTPTMKFPSQCFSGNGLRSAIAFEAEKGYRNALGRKMRSVDYLQFDLI